MPTLTRPPSGPSTTPATGRLPGTSVGDLVGRVVVVSTATTAAPPAPSRGTSRARPRPAGPSGSRTTARSGRRTSFNLAPDGHSLGGSHPVHLRLGTSHWTPAPNGVGTVDEPNRVTRARERAAQAKVRELAAHRRAEQRHEKA